jgi:hypothetical protein
MEDRQDAIKAIQARKKEQLARSAEEAVAGADAVEEGKPREHLHPNPKRGRTDEDGEARKNTAIIDRLNRQLDIYLGYLDKPNLSAEMKSNFERQIMSIQTQLADIFSPPVAPPMAPRKLAPSFSTPPRYSSTGDNLTSPRSSNSSALQSPAGSVGSAGSQAVAGPGLQAAVGGAAGGAAGVAAADAE